MINKIKLSEIFRARVWLLPLTLFLTMALGLPTDSVGADNSFPRPGTEEFTKWNTVTVNKVYVDLKTIDISSRGNPKLGSSLNQLLEVNRGKGLAEAQAFGMSHMMVLQDDRVQVTIVTTEEAIDDVRVAVEAVGGQYQLHCKNLLQALVPIGELEVLAQRPDVLIIREPRRAIPQPAGAPSPMAGDQTTEGVVASNALAWHATGYNGTGVEVAVIDAGFIGYSGLLGTDLPSSVTTYDWTGTGMEAVTEHGTACAEVVYDMAPGITMSLHKVLTRAEVGNAVDQAIADGVDIISMSLAWRLDGPGDGTGFLAEIVNKARSNGIFYATAAGNNAEHCWSGTFTDTVGDDYHEWSPGVQNINFFGPGDGTGLLIQVGTPILVGLHWDNWTAVDQDYDLYMFYWDGSAWIPQYASTDLQNGGPGQTPEEEIRIIAPYTAYYGVVVVKKDATRDVCLRLNAWHGDPRLDEIVSQRSIMFPGDSPDAITVGAVDVSTPYLLKSYSSLGPTFGPGGACTGGSIKPDIVGYANVSTVSYGPQGFGGTSAATPHVGGAAAILKECYPVYTVDEVQNYLEANAIDQGSSGKDNIYGSGRLYLGLPLKPEVTTGSASSVGSSSATLNGIVNPNGSGTTYYFEYGHTISYGSTTPETDIGSGTSDVPVSANIIDLDTDTTYHFRIVATNSYGTSYGLDNTFDTFPVTEYDLTVNIVGSGTVALNPPNGTYDAGTVVTLTATADLYWEFSGWSGDLTGSDNPATITMDSDKYVTATFVEGQHTLTVDTVGQGSVTLDPAGGIYDAGTVVTLTATADLGWLFCNWSGDLTGLDNPATITMNSNKSVTATFINVKLVDGLQITSLGAVDPEVIGETEGRPEDFLYGLIEMEIEVESVGDTAVVIVTLPNPAPAGYKWYKYNASTGWIDFSRDVISGGTGDGAEFNGDRTEVTLYITDNDAYDDDPTERTIKDPSGLGTTPTPPSDDNEGGGGNGGGSGGCFIATAAYGSPMEKHVTMLKNFRDTYLLPCDLGRIFVRIYNQYSPPLAHFIAKHETLRAMVRIGLLPVVGVSWTAVHFGPGATLVLMALLLGLMGVTGVVTLRRIRLRGQA